MRGGRGGGREGAGGIGKLFRRSRDGSLSSRWIQPLHVHQQVLHLTFHRRNSITRSREASFIFLLHFGFHGGRMLRLTVPHFEESCCLRSRRCGFDIVGVHYVSNVNFLDRRMKIIIKLCGDDVIRRRCGGGMVSRRGRRGVGKIINIGFYIRG